MEMWNELLEEMLELVNEIIDTCDQSCTLQVATDVGPRTSTEDTAIPHVSLL